LRAVGLSPIQKTVVMMLRCHGYFPNPTTEEEVATVTVGGRVCWIAFSRICIAIRSKSAEDIAPESLPKNDFTFARVDVSARTVAVSRSIPHRSTGRLKIMNI
jgi:hypothetical protein